MPRWEPNAPERLVGAALDLFAEQGYERTTVIQIAERAGLTKSTFFRHFPDKREVLFGGDAFARTLAVAIAGAPAGAAPLDAVAHALEALGAEVFTAEHRTLTARRTAVIAANPELQEREARKALAITAAMARALRERGTADLVADVAAQLGALALRIAYERWVEAAGDEGFGELARHALGELHAAAARC